MNRINESYVWRKPTPIDNCPELIEFLKGKPRYRDALALRKILFYRHQIFAAWEKKNSRNLRPELVLFD